MSNGECGNKNFNDRAISSNALKEALIVYCENCDKSNPYRCEHCLTNVFEDMIDNTPTVEPIKQCKYCKHCGNEDYCSNCHSDHSLFEYYARPQGDLISRSALKYKNLAEVNGRLTYVLTAEEINKAPTVEPEIKQVPIANVIFDTEKLKELTDEIVERIKNGEIVLQEEKLERPQGEWKLHGMIYYCSVCGHDCEQGGNNFCGNCGADMRGGK